MISTHAGANGSNEQVLVVHTADSRVMRAQALLAQGKRQEAMEEFNSLILEYPKFARGALQASSAALSATLCFYRACEGRARLDQHVIADAWLAV